MFELLLVITLIVLIIGTISDLKTREVPDWLNYSSIFLGIGLRGLFAAEYWDVQILIDGFVGLALAFLAAELMYRTGQWGGGDCKMLMALGAILGVQFRLDHITTTFIFNLLIAGGAYGLVWSLCKGIKNRKGVMERAKQLWKETYHHRLAAYGGFITIAGTGLFLTAPLRMAAITLAFTLAALPFLWVAMKSIEEVAFIKRIPIAKLTEGDWIAKAVKQKNQIVCAASKTGAAKEEIKTLKRLRIRRVWIKEGIPFVPSFLIAYLASLFAGNLFLKLLELLIL